MLVAAGRSCLGSAIADSTSLRGDFGAVKLDAGNSAGAGSTFEVIGLRSGSV